MDLFVYWAEWKVLICRECKYLMGYNDRIPHGKHAVNLGQNLLRPSFHFPRQLP
jgi:hypothetical protein